MSGKTQDWENRYVAPRSKSLESSLQPRPDQDSVEVYPKSSSTQAQLLNQAVIVLAKCARPFSQQPPLLALLYLRTSLYKTPHCHFFNPTCNLGDEIERHGLWNLPVADEARDIGGACALQIQTVGHNERNCLCFDLFG